MHDPMYVRLLLHRQAHFYYVLDKPQTDDRLWDINFNELKAWEATQKSVPKNSPTKCVGCGCPHCKPKSFSAKELKLWAEMTANYNLDPKTRKGKKTS